jgi:hypothetical protein
MSLSSKQRKSKDAVSVAKECGNVYDIEIVIARARKRHQEPNNNPYLASEMEYYIAKELKTQENRRTASRSYRKLGRQIRGHVKPNPIKKSLLAILELPG